MLGQITTTTRDFDLEQTTPEFLDLFAVLVTIAANDPNAWERVNRSLPVAVYRNPDPAEVVIAWFERDPDWRRSGARDQLTSGTLPETVDDLLRRGARAPEIVETHPRQYPLLPSAPRGVAQ